MRHVEDPVLQAMASRRSVSQVGPATPTDEELAGLHTDAPAVRAAHGLGDHERLLGWLYIGDVDPAFRARLEASRKPALDPAPFLGRMPQG